LIYTLYFKQGLKEKEKGGNRKENYDKIMENKITHKDKDDDIIKGKRKTMGGEKMESHLKRERMLIPNVFTKT